MKYALIGKKLSHSFSAKIHEGNGFNYSLCEVAPEKLADFCDNCDYEGFNVTIPYKKDIIPFLSDLSEQAKAIGSVNTVKNVCGKLYGYNTDIIGIDYTFRSEGIDLKDKNVLVLGSGGAGTTAVYYAKSKGAKRVATVSRSGEIDYLNCYDLFYDADVIINATPVGMYPNEGISPVDLSKFKKVSAVFDFIYNPLRTELLIQAEKMKIKNFGGLKMLVAQAVAAENVWKGKEKAFDAEDEQKTIQTANEIYKQNGNVVLFGMPSSGKSIVGKSVAKKLGREFIDTDEIIFERTQKRPSDIIEESGERVFREIESEAVKQASEKRGAVIAVGGGAVLKEENVKALSGNGIMIYLKRDISLLSTEGRPLSKSKGIRQLYEERAEIYERTKDCQVENSTSVEDCVKEVIKVYEDTCNKRC